MSFAIETIGQNIVPGPDLSVLNHGYTSKGVPDWLLVASSWLLVATYPFRGVIQTDAPYCELSTVIRHLPTVNRQLSSDSTSYSSRQ